MKRLESHADEVISLINRRELAAAEQLAVELLRTAPPTAMHLHVYGMALLESGKFNEAEQAFGHAIGLDPNNPASHLKRGDALMAASRHGRALKSYERAVVLSPKFAVARQGMADAQFAIGDLARAEVNYKLAIEMNSGLHDAVLSLSAVQQRLGKYEDALRSIEWLLARDARNGVAWTNRGSLCFQSGRFEDAAESYMRALAVLPGLAVLHDNLGMSLMASGRAEEAIVEHSRAIEIDPAFVLAYSRRALAKHHLQQLDDAYADAEEAFKQAPDHPMVRNVRGVVLGAMGRFDEAQYDLGRALELAPEVPEFWNNWGSVLMDQGRYASALERLDQAIRLRESYPEAHSNRGLALLQAGELDQAAIAFDQAVEHGPVFPEAFKRRANLKLLRGEFADGWRDFQASLNLRRTHDFGLSKAPRWEGQALLGKSILLTEPHGFGDLFQFWRYVPKLLAMGADVFFMGPPRIFRILQSSQYKVRYLEQLPEGKRFDFHAELWTLPMALGTDTSSIPDGVPYLHAEKERLETWQRILPLSTRNIGVFWQGTTRRLIDPSRIMRLLDLEPLSEVPGVRLVSLQKGAGVEQLQTAKNDIRMIVPDETMDADYAFVDTAALIQRLDLVVTVDSSVAHLAGAMGRPVWVALPAVPDWCWGLEGDRSAWYPSATLFRQTREGGWPGVIDAMRDALLARRSAR